MSCFAFHLNSRTSAYCIILDAERFYQVFCSFAHRILNKVLAQVCYKFLNSMWSIIIDQFQWKYSILATRIIGYLCLWIDNIGFFKDKACICGIGFYRTIVYITWQRSYSRTCTTTVVWYLCFLLNFCIYFLYFLEICSIYLQNYIY